MSLTYTNLTSLTERHIKPYIVDNVYNSQALLMRLKKKGIKVRGGSSIQVPIMHAALTSGTSFNGSDTWSAPTADVAQFTNADFAWKEYVVPFAVSHRLAFVQNQGDEAQVDYLEAVIKGATQEMSEQLSDGLFSDGTTNSSKVITGLLALMSTTSTYGGIAVADAAVWKAKAGTLTNAGELTIADLQALWGQCTVGSDMPTLSITTQAVFDKYASLLEPQRRYVNTDKANAGFPTLEFMGKPVMVDNHTPGTGSGTADSYWFLLNEKYVSLFTKDGQDMNVEKVPAQVTSMDHFYKIYWAGNLACENRRMFGYIATIDPGIV